MAGGWLPFSVTTTGVNAKNERWPAGDGRSWSVTVPRDLTGYTAEWRLGIPDSGSVPSLSVSAFTPPQIAVLKTSSNGLVLNPVSTGVWALSWMVTEADTIKLPPGVYCHQTVVISPQSGPVTVDEGFITLSPSLRATDLDAP